VFRGLVKYSDGCDAVSGAKSDNVIFPTDVKAPKCPQCNTMVLPVPSVLRSMHKTWYNPVRTSQYSNMPISQNGTLGRLFGADVILLRLRKVAKQVDGRGERKGGYAKIYDIAIPLHKDPIHTVYLEAKEQNVVFGKRRWHSARNQHLLHVL
jgi:hypothetical protein